MTLPLKQARSEFAHRGRAKASEGMAAASITFRIPVGETGAVQALWLAVNDDKTSGAAKTSRVLSQMELACIRPKMNRRNNPRVLDTGAGGWWENDWDDLALG